MDWILGRASVQSPCGATLGNIKVTDLDFADDVAIISKSLETLVVALDAFSNEAKPLSLEVSWTKIQDFGHLSRELFGWTKLHVFKALTMPVLLYGSETWKLNCALESQLDAFCNKSLCRIMGYCCRDHVSNQQLNRETGTRPVTCTIRDRQLRLYAH
ncbi:uncharacterized protein [Penaeus vannamei]|uniref:uncharacterized protein n=1 Tax=Penaeus vannamei TaxID=6689 RepID=UPI00387F3F05